MKHRWHFEKPPVVDCGCGRRRLGCRDYSTLILAAWLLLRTTPPLWHRLWLLVGVLPMQALPLGLPALQLIWDACWLVILGVSSFSGSGESAPATQRATGSAVRGDT